MSLPVQSAKYMPIISFDLIIFNVIIFYIWHTVLPMLPGIIGIKH